MRIHIDLETRSEVDLKKCGGYRYATDPSTEVMILAYSRENMVETMTKNFQPEWFLRRALEGHTLHAFNAQFERLIFKHVLGVDIPAEHWRCTMVQAYSRGFSGGLAQVGYQLGVDEVKDCAGGALIGKFSKMLNKTYKEPHEDPEAFSEFVKYCRQDVIAEMAIYEALQ